jgi:hypothetical protein
MNVVFEMQTDALHNASVLLVRLLVATRPIVITSYHLEGIELTPLHWCVFVHGDHLWQTRSFSLVHPKDFSYPCQGSQLTSICQERNLLHLYT